MFILIKEIVLIAFCEPATIDEIKTHGYVLTLGRYMGAKEMENDDVPFEKKMAELSATLHEQFAETRKLDEVICKKLGVLGFGK